MKKIIIVVVLLAAGWYGWRWWQDRQQPPRPVYREEVVKRGTVRVDIMATALAKPQNRLELNSPVAGRIDAILVREGDPVTNGQILGWVSSTDRATLLDAARARGGAEAERWADMYKPAPLIAPLDATVIDRKMEPGQSVSPSAAILVLSDRLIIEAAVDETDIRSIRIGQPVSVEFDAYRGETFAARVDHIAYDADTKSGVTLYAIDVLCDQTPAFLRSAMSANVRFLVAETNDVLTLPIAAIQRGEAQPEVLRPGAGPEAEPVRVPIQTGLDDGSFVEVREGLAEGDVVLVQDMIQAASATALSNPLVPSTRMGGRGRR
jgi:macrolide-specific efflux system membrane fusion protein